MKGYHIQAHAPDHRNRSTLAESLNTMGAAGAAYGLLKHEHLKADTNIAIYAYDFIVPLAIFNPADENLTPLKIEQIIIAEETKRRDRIAKKELS